MKYPIQGQRRRHLVGNPGQDAAHVEEGRQGGNRRIFKETITFGIIQALHANDKFTEEEMHNYRMAVTEREVRNGCITMPDNYVKDHVIIYTRILNNINLQNLKRASAFIDIMDRHIDQEAQEFLSYYRDVLAKNKMLNNKGIYKRLV